MKRGTGDEERYALEQQRAKTARARASKAEGREGRAARRKQTRIEEIAPRTGMQQQQQQQQQPKRRLSVDTRKSGGKADRVRSAAGSPIKRSPTKQKMARTPPGLIRSPRAR